MCPPEFPIRVGRLAGRHHAARVSALINGYDFDGVQIIRGETELAAKESKGATDDMSAHADLRVLAEWDHYSPGLEQRAERFTDCGASLDGDGAHFRVVVNAFHWRDIDDHTHVGIRDESLETVPATRHNETLSFLHRLLYSRHDLISRADQADVVWACAESFIETLIDNRAIPRIFGADFEGFDLSVVGRLWC